MCSGSRCPMLRNWTKCSNGSPRNRARLRDAGPTGRWLAALRTGRLAADGEPFTSSTSRSTDESPGTRGIVADRLGTRVGRAAQVIRAAAPEGFVVEEARDRDRRSPLRGGKDGEATAQRSGRTPGPG